MSSHGPSSVLLLVDVELAIKQVPPELADEWSEQRELGLDVGVGRLAVEFRRGALEA